MTPDNLLIIILSLIVFNFVFGVILSVLNLENLKREIPEELRDVYTPEEWTKARKYQKVNFRFSLVSGIISTTATLVFIALGGFGWLYSTVEVYVQNPIFLGIVFFGVLGFASDIIGMPFSLYHTFVIEEQFGFNNSTMKIWIIDKIKGYALGTLIGAPLLALLFFLLQELGSNFWLIFWLVAGLFTLFMNAFYTSLILPWFNKLSPLEDGTLREKIEHYAQKIDFPLTNIMVIDGSKRSNRSNAFFSGLGKQKKVVFYDTMLKDHDENELMAVLAHEIGHYKKKHIITGMVLSLLQMGLILFILSLFVFNGALSQALGYDGMSMAINLIAFSILFSPISSIIGIFFNFFSRKNEYEADAYAKATWNDDDLIRALKNLTQKNLGNILPHPVNVFLSYSHPTLLQRIRALKS